MHILRVPIPVGREPPVPQDDGVCPISLHRLASRRRLADDLELEAWVELHGQAVWRIYIYILLLPPHFSKRISVGSYGKSTKISALSWERTEKPKDESGKK